MSSNGATSLELWLTLPDQFTSWCRPAPGRRTAGFARRRDHRRSRAELVIAQTLRYLQPRPDGCRHEAGDGLARHSHAYPAPARRSGGGVRRTGHVADGDRAISCLRRDRVGVHPYLSEERAASSESTKVDWTTVFSPSDIVSLHAPAPETAGIVMRRDFECSAGSVVINMSRGHCQ